jgi:hypothetical protein
MKRVQRCHRFLENKGYILTTNLLKSFFRNCEEILTVKPNMAGWITGPFKKSYKGKSRDTFSGSGFAHKRYGFPGFHRKGDVFDQLRSRRV